MPMLTTLYYPHLIKQVKMDDGRFIDLLLMSKFLK